MPVNSTRPEYDDSLTIWQKCRDVVEGQEAIHAAGITYLPKLSGQTNAEYQAYVARALFYNATQRTADAMTGLLFRKSPMITIPKVMEEWAKDIDLKGTTLDNFVEDLADEVMVVGRYGLLVEYPQVIIEGEDLTQADAEALNLRPFLVKYPAENIINWKTTTYNNQEVVSLIVLKEYAEVLTDEYDVATEIRYRVLDIFEGKYRQRLFSQPDETKDNFILLFEIFPVINGQNFSRIPFVMINAKGVSVKIQKSPILDLANVNISHYQSTADLEHGAHFTGLPTAVVTGHRLQEGTALKIGSSEAWVFSEEQAKAYYLEFSGQGLDALEKRIDKKEQQMAALGARMLANEKAAAETVETHTIKRQGENSALSSIAQAIQDGVIKALTIMAEWGGLDTNIQYEINRDFIPNTMDASQLIALLQIWQSGGMAFSDFIRNLQHGEVIDASRTPEDIKAELEVEGPTLAAMGVVNAQDQEDNRDDNNA